VGLLPRRRERVVGPACHAEFALGRNVVRAKVGVVDRPIGSDAALGARVEIGLVESHHHPLPVKRRSADSLDSGVIEGVEPLAACGVGVALTTHFPDVRPIVRRSDCPLLAFQTIRLVEPWPRLQHHDLVFIREAVGDQPACGPGPDHAHVGVGHR
jgi:hypothetical protein